MIERLHLYTGVAFFYVSTFSLVSVLFSKLLLAEDWRLLKILSPSIKEDGVEKL
jgi:hypothetical protein